MIKRALCALSARWSSWPQLVCHQVGWWACVVWMGWAGPAVMIAFIGLHLYIVRERIGRELIMVSAAAIIGIVLDSSLAITGAVSYVGSLKVWASPFWLVAIWAGFGATLLHSQSILVRNRMTSILTGALGGPAAYWGGERLERMSVNPEMGWVAVSATWTAALFILGELATRLRRSSTA